MARGIIRLPMTGLRAFFRHHAALAILIAMLAIAVRALVPAGYMTSASATGLTVELCSGVAGKTITIALPSTDHRDDGRGKSQADSPCASAGLGGGALAAVDPFLLAIAIAFILAAGLLPVALRLPRGTAQVRPPLRGPPLIG
jgi:hypothetical protein